MLAHLDYLPCKADAIGLVSWVWREARKVLFGCVHPPSQQCSEPIIQVLLLPEELEGSLCIELLPCRSIERGPCELISAMRSTDEARMRHVTGIPHPAVSASANHSLKGVFWIPFVGQYEEFT